MKNDLVNELSSTKVDLLNAMGLFEDEDINTIPFEGSWTGGQVAEHVLKSASAVADALNGPAEPSDRDPAQHIPLFAQIFLNFDHKLKSPDFILPSDEPKDRKTMQNALNEVFGDIEEETDSGDLDLICTAFEMPTIGRLSRKELISFTIVHTQRHIHQLKNIAKHFEKP